MDAPTAPLNADKAAPSSANPRTEAAPSKPDKGKNKVIETSSPSPSQSPSTLDNSSDESAPEVIVSSPESSPERYEHPKIEAWEEDI